MNPLSRRAALGAGAAVVATIAAGAAAVYPLSSKEKVEANEIFDALSDKERAAWLRVGRVLIDYPLTN